MTPFVAFANILEALANEWVKHFRHSPFLTLAATVTTLVLVGITFQRLDAHKNEKRQAVRLENPSFREQLNQVDEMENNVIQLLDFLEQQKATLSDTEETISRLRTEKNKLEPLVETDRQVVEAIFRAHEERVSTSVWIERLIGFVLGIVASLVATFIWFVVMKLARPQKYDGDTGLRE